jgi:CBS domain-containing protein
MKTVAELLRAKSNPEVVSVSPEQTVLEAISVMAEKGIGALVVVDGSQLVGIVSERDYARKVVLMERSSYNTQVREIMTANVITVQPGQSNEHCMKLMTDGRLRHLPVVDGNTVVGMISIGDLVKDVIADQQKVIHQLESYIRGE